MRLSQRRSATNVVSGAQQVVRGDFKSRYLKLFQGVARQNLALLEFYDYYQAGATGAGAILLNYGEESPAMAALHHGLGTLLLLNFSAGELSSNLARQRLFPAWMQDLVKALSAEELPPAAYTIGETLHTEVWRSEMREQGFKSPSGGPVTVRRELAGERYSVTFTPDELGFYTLGPSRPLYAFGINTSPDEADLRPINKAVLPQGLCRRARGPFRRRAPRTSRNWPKASRCFSGSFWGQWRSFWRRAGFNACSRQSENRASTILVFRCGEGDEKPKTEIRNPKENRKPKSEGRDRKAFGHWPEYPGARLFHVAQRIRDRMPNSDFGFRILSVVASPLF